MDNEVDNDDDNTIHRVWIRTTDCSLSSILPSTLTPNNLALNIISPIANKNVIVITFNQ